MRDGVAGHGRAIRAALSLVVALLVAGCGQDAATPPAADQSSEPGPSAAAGPPSARSTPSPSDPVTGGFRRGGVPVPPDLLGTVVAACRSFPTPAHVDEVGSRPVAVSDLRGDGVVLVVFAASDGATGCRVTLRDDGPVATLFPVEAKSDGPLTEGEITLGAYELDADGTSERTIAVGQYGDRVVKVRAGFDDDTYVTSSTANGWYAMWWQGSVRPAVIVAADNRNEAMGKLTPPKGSPAP